MSRSISAGVRIGLLVLGATAVVYWAYKLVSTKASGSDGYTLKARFRDATGLPINSRVVIAGLPVGEIVERKLEGRFALLSFRIRRQALVYDNAIVRKKTSSLLGEYYLDIDPGSAQTKGPDGRPVKHQRLADGQQVPTVIEAASTDELLRQVSEAIPRVEAALSEAHGMFVDTRRVINGPVQGIADNVNELVQDNRELVAELLKRTARAAESFERVGSNLAHLTGAGRQPLLNAVHNAEQASEDLKVLIAAAKGEVTLTGEKLREKLDRLDRTLDNLDATFASSSSVAKKIDSEQGTLGKLVNDPDIANNVETLTDDLVRFSKSSFGLKTIVGLRTEWHMLSGLPKAYLSLELKPRDDKFYLVEIVDDPRGTITEDFVLDPATGGLVSATRVDRSFRWTLQFAKQVENYTFRLGMKESSGGLGADAVYFDGRLTVNTDLYEPTFNRYPRVKARAAMNFFKYLYIYAGIDDALNRPQNIGVVNPDITGAPIAYRFGRDYFGGVMFRFTDEDLAGLLFMGGSAMGAAVSQ